MAVPLLALPVPPASATTTTTGSAAFAGVTTLPTFPCQPPPPFGNGPCHSSFRGHWSGQIAGVHNTAPFEATWSTSGDLPAGISALFTYAEWDCNLHAETLLGIARGSGSAHAPAGQMDGFYQVPGEGFRRAILSATLNFSFRWTRVGAQALITLTPATLVIEVNGIGSVTVLDGAQTGTAAFVPTSTGNTVPPNCNTQLSDVTGTIAGDLALSGTL